MSAPFVGDMEWVKQERERIDRLKRIVRTIRYLCWAAIAVTVGMIVWLVYNIFICRG